MSNAAERERMAEGRTSERPCTSLERRFLVAEVTIDESQVDRLQKQLRDLDGKLEDVVRLLTELVDLTKRAARQAR